MDDALVEAMMGVVDDLYGHVHRVADLSVQLGKSLELPQEDLERLGVVGILHDVGKIHVDPSILAKPGPLTGPETVHMRRHPEIGYAMTVARFDRGVSEAILFHHERYDGAGYPFGLAGTDIPLLSRVVLVADAYDAITSHRAYQPALPMEFAIDEITQNAGTQFDPMVVETFLGIAAAGTLPVPRSAVAGLAAS
jgi:HD-GYP domain-containing protein (c-di-GMP phosphodiesterase class II)